MARKQRKMEEWENNMVETKSAADIAVDIILYVLIVLVALCSVLPMWHVLMSSFSDGKSLLAHVGLVLWPVGGFTVEGYKMIFQNASIVSGYINTIIYTVSFTTIGIVYGGGYGANATVVGNPTVSIQQQPGAFAADIDDDGDGNPDANAAALGTLGTVFGGGNAAQVIGSTRVLVGTTNNTARIDGNVYGGGNKADVSGNTDVSIGKAESGE